MDAEESLGAFVLVVVGNAGRDDGRQPAVTIRRSKMSLVGVEPEVAELAEELYEKLPSQLTYVAELWLEQLLEPLGYVRKDQNKFTQALRSLCAQGRLTIRTVRVFNDRYIARNCDLPRPRQVVITKTRRT